MWLGDYPEDFATVVVPFGTYQSSGAAVAPNSAFETADFKIYKNGSATEKTSTNGLTIASPFDSTTGLHFLTIDTSNDTGDAAFWVAGAVYTVVLVPDETVDGVAVMKVVGQFGLGLSAGALLDLPAGVETGFTFRQVMRLMSSVLLGKSSGHPGSPVYRDVNDTKNRVSATVSSGNRSAVTRDAT